MAEAMIKTGTGSRRAALHYTWTVLMLSIYGGQVCPYIEGLPITYWLAVLGGFYLAAFALRGPISRVCVSSAPYEKMPWRQFAVELALFALAALGITLLNMAIYEFPFGSGMKVVVGSLTFGFFAAADLALERERQIAAELARDGRSLEPSERFMPMTTRFRIVAAGSVALVMAVIFLVLSKDLEWLGNLGSVGHARARFAVLGELLFIAAVVLVGLFNLISSYSRNLSMFLDNENSSLMAVAGGDFARRVTVSTNDEFGVMGAYTNRMIEKLGRNVSELRRTQDATIQALATLAEIRDMETGLHIVRTRLYVRALAAHMSTDPRYAAALPPETIELLYKSAPLHDIGKVGIPDAVLMKPARLTPEEYSVMKTHPRLGGDALGEAERVLGESSFLRLAREIAYTHHEKWDGSGYPAGLSGADIPLSGRLMALADVYDALVFKRVYKPALSHAETRAIIIGDRGRHFDPDVVDAFLAIEEQFVAISSEYAEAEPAS